MATCPRCGSDLAGATSRDGLCARCLLGLGREAQEAPGGTELVTDDLPVESLGAESEHIGPYRLLEKLGEGGMGTVWLAEQTEPVRRRVALKIIKHGMDTKQVVARFEAERQALAMMDHPCVAKVFEAGATPHGRPYFAMEHVQGVPITEHCDRQRLTTNERLALFRRVCGGVQHAHQKAIIHRDLKPSNVLVSYRDGKSEPKIIDFGVAKATSQRLTEKTLFTETGMLIGTPEYMSPEQAEMTGQNVDTRTDVYALGVMLYELLTGALPFDARELRESGYEGIRRKIREEEPSKPSTRLSTLGGESSTESAQRRKTDLSTLQRQLRGDLDWITMRALEKDRARRYGSPAELAADVERHLQHQPVVAGPPSAGYRARKFAKRHRLGVGIAAAAVLVLVMFAGTMTVQAGRIARERDRANREAEAAKQTSEFLENLFEISDPDEARGSTVTARELLDRSAERIRSGEMESEEVRARLLLTMGNVYRKLGLYDSAAPLLNESLVLRRSILGDEHPATLWSMTVLAVLYWNQGRYAEAEQLALETLERKRRVLGDEDPATLGSMNNLAVVYADRGRHVEAERLYHEVLDIQRRMWGEEDPATLSSMNNLAGTYAGQGRYGEAEQLHRATLEIRRRVLGEDHPDTLTSMNGLANACSSQGRYDEAERLYRETLEIQRRVLGEDHPDTLGSMNNLAVSCRSQGRYADAEQLQRATLELQRRKLGEDHPDTLGSASNLASLCASQGRLAEAEQLQRDTLEKQRRVLGEDHPHTLLSMSNLAGMYSAQGRFGEAEPLHRETLEIRRRVLGEAHPETLGSMNNLANAYSRYGRHDEAERLYRETLEIQRRVLGPDQPDTLASMNNLAWLLLIRVPADTRDPEAALQLALEAADKTAYENPDYLDTLSLAYHLTGDTAMAIENQKRAIALLPEGDSALRRSFEGALARFEAGR